jgi:hypothetical protein
VTGTESATISVSIAGVPFAQMCMYAMTGTKVN